MKKKRKMLIWFCALALVLCAYPAFVLGYTWSCVFKSDFQGGRHGPLDAYRHALASSVVSYTLGRSAVDLVTTLCESGGRRSNRMDSHNNRIGATIGLRSRSFFDLEPSVRRFVLKGTVNSTNTDQITWLPEKEWRNARIW
jgi:hypothetical protein